LEQKEDYKILSIPIDIENAKDESKEEKSKFFFSSSLSCLQCPMMFSCVVVFICECLNWRMPQQNRSIRFHNF
jgi:hypothetical protein